MPGALSEVGLHARPAVICLGTSFVPHVTEEQAMAMSDDERRRLRALEAEISQQRRLVRLARQLESAHLYTGFQRIARLWIAGGSVGLFLVVVGALVSSTGLLTVAVIILTGTVITVGVASIVVEVSGYRREQRDVGRT
jgi:hypothetical protein